MRLGDDPAARFCTVDEEGVPGARLDAGCPGALRRGEDGVCRETCDDARDCGVGRECEGEVCVEDGGAADGDADVDADVDADADADGGFDVGLDADEPGLPDGDLHGGGDDADLGDGDADDLPAECADGVDNDGDGWVDRDDPGCARGWGEGGLSATRCNDHEGPPTSAACTDGLDNGGDGWVDALDAECNIADRESPWPAYDWVLPCQDLVDNDGDGRVDADDPGCRSGDDPSEEP